jgi:hypothetical protein
VGDPRPLTGLPADDDRADYDEERMARKVFTKLTKSGRDRQHHGLGDSMPWQYRTPAGAFLLGVGSVFDITGATSMRGLHVLTGKSPQHTLLDDRCRLHRDGAHVIARLDVSSGHPFYDAQKVVKSTLPRVAPRDARVVVKQTSRSADTPDHDTEWFAFPKRHEQ